MPACNCCTLYERFERIGITFEKAQPYLKRFTTREQRIIKYRWKCQLTYDEISKIFDVTRERIRQIEHKRIFRKFPIILYSLILERLRKTQEKYLEIGDMKEYWEMEKDIRILVDK